MISTKNIRIAGRQQFFTDTLHGLKSNPKFLESKYFYDQHGDKLFQQIMDAPEYYLTGCEMEIFSGQSRELSKTIAFDSGPFDLIELGAGDATKSIHLLRQMMQDGLEFSYFPVDISENVIRHLSVTLPEQLPGLDIHGLNGDYFDMMERVAELSARRKVILFMGSNIGNMSVSDARLFCQKLRSFLSPDDLVVIGFDLKKHPKQILSAYDDRDGITRAFNLNLLTRINRELGADFNPEFFEHYACYDPESGACKSYLISLKNQTVRLGDTELIRFTENEYIFMEISQKYALPEIDAMGISSGFKPVKHFTDRKGYFVDAIWKAK